jgi:predicted methyltransferase
MKTASLPPAAALVALLVLFGPATVAKQPPPPETAIIQERSPETIVGGLITDAIVGAHRSDTSIARNIYRNPTETLLFFGLRPDMTVVEVWPGTGWYTEVLAPVLGSGGGRLIAAQFPLDAEVPYQSRTAQTYAEKLRAEPEVYAPVEVVPFAPPRHRSLGPPESADLVLLFRNFHSLIAGDVVEDTLQAAYDVLRPGGVLGVVQHRAAEDAPAYEERQDGYVRQSHVIERVTEAGFTFEESAETNANTADRRNHPRGVWTLLPTLAYCREMQDAREQLACEQEYRAIGESDRMTLRFSKPR